jgi:hypothetical protein
MPSGYSADDIEFFLKKRNKKLQFTPILEAAYQERRREQRARIGRAQTIRSIIIYNLFLVNDYVLLPHTFKIALFLHTCVCTPAIILAGATLKTRSSLAWRDWTSCKSYLLLG